MTDTPETDRLAEEFKRNTLTDDVKLDILFSFTRKLEQVGNETQKDLEFRRELFKVQEDQLNKVWQERDIWRKRCEALQKAK